MHLAPLLEASPAIRIHAFAALAALPLGLIQFAGAKGTLPHRALGTLWAGLMLIVAVSSFWIHGMRWIGPFGPIHLLSLFVLWSLPISLWRAHRGDAERHAKGMRGLFMGGLILAGLFTLWPGRIMHAVLFGS